MSHLLRRSNNSKPRRGRGSQQDAHETSRLPPLVPLPRSLSPNHERLRRILQQKIADHPSAGLAAGSPTHSIDAEVRLRMRNQCVRRQNSRHVDERDETNDIV